MSGKEKELNNKLKELRRIYSLKIPIAILFGVLFSLIYPYLPRKGGRPAMIDVMDYSTAVIQSAILIFIILLISYYWVISKKKKEIENLEREVHLEKKNIKKYNSISNFKQ